MNNHSGKASEFARYKSNRERMEYNAEEIGNQMSYKKEDMWKQVCEAWYSVVLDVVEELYSSMPRKNADLIKAKEGATKHWIYNLGVHVC